MALEIPFFSKEQILDLANIAGNKAIIIAIILVVGYIIIRIITHIIARFFEKVKFDRAAETFVENVVKVGLWAVLLIIILANLGINVSGLIAGLGVMGFIVGFALKDTLGNLASGVFILFHKPFSVDDYVDAGGVQGIVQAIGVAACTFRTPDNKKVVVPNSAIWGSPIINFTGLGKRRMEIKIGISYSSNMDKALKIVNDILKKDKRVLKDPASQVVIGELGDSSVNLFIRPWVTVPNYWDLYFYLTKTIKQQFDKNRIEIPFPQRDVHIKKK